MAALLIGYDVERMNEPEITRSFLRKAAEVHREHPCTLFLVGRVVEDCARDLDVLASNPMFDFQQHTYSHRLLKTVCMERDGAVTVYPGMPFDEIASEVAKTSELLKGLLGKDCLGLTGPYAYYRGLSDRPDILAILHELGIRFTRTYGRNEHDFQPVPFEIQPFWYDAQGFADILEIPIQGWQDVYWREINGWENIEDYTRFLLQCLDYVRSKDLTWSYATHDWSSIRNDPEMTAIRELLTNADEAGVQVLSHAEFYMAQKKAKC